MADSGLTRFLGRGIQFSTGKTAATSVGLRTVANPATSFYFNVPTTLPGATSALTVDASGNLAYATLGSGGSVTSVGLAAPAIFTVTNSPVTASGTLTLGLATQTQNTVWAAPNGSTGAPTFRSLVAADIPSLLSTQISNFAAAVQATRLDQLTSPTATVNMSNQVLAGLATPTNAQDAVTKAYADALVEGRNNSGTARVGLLSNINLAAPGATIDGITLSNGELFAALGQTNGTQNGLYVYNGAAVAATRATSADTSAEVKPGLFIFVSEGSTCSGNGYTLVTPGPILLDTTVLTFSQTSGAGQINAGSGMTKSGNTLDVVGIANRITVLADSVDIAASYVGQTSITTLGTVTTGTWNGVPVEVARGGTGATTSNSARLNLSAAGVSKGTFNNANLTAGVLTVTHPLSQQYGQVTIIDEVGYVATPDNVQFLSTSSYTVDLSSFGTISGTWQLVFVA